MSHHLSCTRARHVKKRTFSLISPVDVTPCHTFWWLSYFHTVFLKRCDISVCHAGFFSKNPRVTNRNVTPFCIRIYTIFIPSCAVFRRSESSWSVQVARCAVWQRRVVRPRVARRLRRLAPAGFGRWTGCIPVSCQYGAPCCVFFVRERGSAAHVWRCGAFCRG